MRSEGSKNSMQNTEDNPIWGHIFVYISLLFFFLLWIFILVLIDYSKPPTFNYLDLPFFIIAFPPFIFWFIFHFIYYRIQTHPKEPLLEFTGISIRNKVTTSYKKKRKPSRKKKKKTLFPKSIHVRDIPPNAIDLWTHEPILQMANKGNPIMRCPGCGAYYEKSSWEYFGGCAKPECREFAKK